VSGPADEDDARSPRDEAERLVAAALGAASRAVQGLDAQRQLRDLVSGTGFATGSAECCICPLCRLIAVLREPNVEFAERLASGAGDIAVGLAGVLRAFGSAAQGGDGWHPATDPVPEDEPPPAPADRPPPPKKAAKKAAKKMAKKAVKKAPHRPPEGAGERTGDRA
jgi:hypothetical protein